MHVSDRLYRSRSDRILAGVAGGLAELWNLDPAIVRVAWAVLVPVTSGLALLAYIVLAIVVPEAPSPAPGAPSAESDATADADPSTAQPLAREDRRRTSPGLIFGAILVIAGVYLLLQEFVPGFDAERLWPFVLVGVGIVLLIMASGRRGSTS
jgi:phage shock protein C